MSDQTANSQSWLIHFADVLAGGLVGFLSSLLLEPAKKILFKPKIEFDFPIDTNTDLQCSSTTSYIPLIVIPTLGNTKEIISVRCVLKNLSKTFTAEGCRVFLTSIETRENKDQAWKTTEYKEFNQVAWNEKQFEFEELDIYPSTSRAIEVLSLDHNSLGVTVRIQDNHSVFNYLFHSPTPPGKGWKYSLLAVGKNISPIHFELILECVPKSSLGISPLIFQINGCRVTY